LDESDQRHSVAIMTGKGDKRRPMKIDYTKFDENWERAFGKSETRNVPRDRSESDRKDQTPNKGGERPSGK
jgi:hypothetical protein